MRGGVAEEDKHGKLKASTPSSADANSIPNPIIPEGWQIIGNVVLRSTDRCWNSTFQEWRKTKLWGEKPSLFLIYIRKNK